MKTQTDRQAENALKTVFFDFRQGNDPQKFVEHISDYSNCTCTAYFDPFTMKYADWLLNIVKIRPEMLPRPVSNSFDLGCIDSSIFGCEIKISASIADQAASMWGQCCFRPGDVKVTMGTGAFLNINCGTKCHASNHGLYPLVGWQVAEQEVIYCIEGASNDMGSTIEWASRVGLIDNINLSADVANSVASTEGVYFVPAFAGLGAPINNQTAACGFIGIKPSTSKQHLVRAILESLAFRVAILVQCTREETKFKLSVIK